MARYCTGSQTRSVMRKKEEIARQLLERGLTVAQIQAQLNCSGQFVRRIREQLAVGTQ